ncbi:MAG: ATP-binding protein, partial [Caldilineaceae bacterium]|nr:ATP-binding protein [Caldilineaceae bacterium]
PWPTFALALHVCAAPSWESLAPGRPLRRWHLVELQRSAARPLTAAPLRIDERVLHHLIGLDRISLCVDARLDGLVTPVTDAPAMLAPSHVALAQQLAATVQAAADDARPPLVHLAGADGQAGRALAATVCRDVGMGLFTLAASALPADPAAWTLLARLWEREAVFGRAALLVECGEETASLRVLDDVAGLVFVTAPQSGVDCRRPCLHFDVSRPTRREQRLLWDHALGESAGRWNGAVDALVNQFDLDAGTIDAIGRQTADADAAWDACRVRTRPHLDELAQRIEPAAGWDDLVLPAGQLQVLRELALHVRRRAVVYDTWGFAAKSSRGLGISALFAGVSGTGKTMAAEVLARELRLDLYRIDLSGVVSKYIGETEKNLRRVFDAAEHGGALLLFDEADALFGKRTEVRDSHDRYANIEVSYLLQRMEAYRGLAILTTNQRSALDTAFLRRIRFVVEFPFPDATQRAEIWRRIFPDVTPTVDLDVHKLSRLTVTGGHIRNIALYAAFLAADRDEPVQMAHLLAAAQREYAKLEKPLGDAEVRTWVA